MSRRLILSSIAGKQRRFLSSSFSSSKRYHHAFSCARNNPFLLDSSRYNKERERTDAAHLNALPIVRVHGTPFNHTVRWFSASSTSTTTRRERAAESARRGAETARKSARRGAKVARKGARTASELFKQYGPVFVGTYLGIYCATLATLFGGIDSGLLDPVTVIHCFHFGKSEVAMESKSTVDMVVHMLEQYTWTKKYATTVANNPHAANLAVAWVATKFTEPVRLLLTIGTVPRIAKWLGREVHAPQDSDDEKEENGEDRAEEKEEETDKSSRAK